MVLTWPWVNTWDFSLFFPFLIWLLKVLSTHKVSQLYFLTRSYASDFKISKYVCQDPIKILEILRRSYWKSFGMYKWTGWLSLCVTSNLVECLGKFNFCFVSSGILGDESASYCVYCLCKLLLLHIRNNKRNIFMEVDNAIIIVNI